MKRNRFKPASFSREDLVLAGLGGLVVGVIVSAAVSRRSYTLPAGAVSAPLLLTTGPSIINLAARVEARPGTTVPASVRAGFRFLPKPKAIAESMRHFATADALMRACPTQAEINKILSDFNIALPLTNSARWPTCTDGGVESGAILYIVNMFRMAYAMNFDTPMPILGITSPYEYLRSLNLNWHFASSGDFPGLPYSHAAGNDVFVLIDGLDDPIYRISPVLQYPHPHGLPGPGNVGVPTGAYHAPYAVMGVAVLLHEARHTDPGGAKLHLCARSAIGSSPAVPNANDTSLAYGGAWGVEYWCDVWSATHLTPSFLTPLQQSEIMSSAQTLRGRTGVFCNEETATSIVRYSSIK